MVNGPRSGGCATEEYAGGTFNRPSRSLSSRGTGFTHAHPHYQGTRRDGSHTQGPIGPSLPYHDLAHYVVERELRMSEGFFGQIASGRSIDELNDPTVIRGLPPQVWEAEVITRTLQGLGNGAVAQSEFRASVEAELQRVPQGITDETGTRMLDTYMQLLNACGAGGRGGCA